MAKKQIDKKTPGTQIYIGPTIPRTMLQRYTVFRGELHPSVLKVADQVPAVKRLIVDVKEMAGKEQKLADKSSLEAQMFASVVNHVKEVTK